MSFKKKSEEFTVTMRFRPWELLLILCSSITVLGFLLALFSHSPLDPSVQTFVSVPEVEINNLLGPWGANLSGFMYYYFGLASFFILIPLIACHKILLKSKAKFMKKMLYLLSSLCSLVPILLLGSLVFSEWMPRFTWQQIPLLSGGVTGFYSNRFLTSIVGFTGSILAQMILLLISFFLINPESFAKTFHKLIFFWPTEKQK